MPVSRIKQAIAEVLRDEGYIESFEDRGEGIGRVLRVHLRYAPGGRGRDPILMGIQRISKPGLRVYARASEIPRVFGGLGTAILSTPQGVMSGTQARRRKVGGEVLAHVW
jgi:small subunit ribosomal protein S8